MFFKPIPKEDGSIEFVPSDEPYLPTEPAQPVELPYNIKRYKEYPQIADQLDMIWHMMDDETIPGKGSEWYNTILEIKNKYPKP